MGEGRYVERCGWLDECFVLVELFLYSRRYCFIDKIQDSKSLVDQWFRSKKLFLMKKEVECGIVEPSKSGEIAISRISKVVSSVHVVSKSDGGWSVKQGGGQRVDAHFSKKSDAVKYGKELSQARHTGMYVHSKNGTVQEVNGLRDKAVSGRS